MELKEIVNLRKLREYLDDSLDDEKCEFCPLRDICTSLPEFENCIAENILNAAYRNENKCEDEDEQQ